jgi:hypothetical protein
VRGTGGVQALWTARDEPGNLLRLGAGWANVQSMVLPLAAITPVARIWSISPSTFSAQFCLGTRAEGGTLHEPVFANQRTPAPVAIDDRSHRITLGVILRDFA